MGVRRAEPIPILPDPASSYVNNVKLRPGVRPLLSFNSHWDVQNQGAYPEGKNDTADVKVTGGGKKLVASWVGKHEKGRFATKLAMAVGWDGEDGRVLLSAEVNGDGADVLLRPGPLAIAPAACAEDRPAAAHLAWHRAEVFRGRVRS